MADRYMTGRPDLLDAPPTAGARIKRAEPPVGVVVTVRWSDTGRECLQGMATHWAWPLDGRVPVVHCRLDGSRFGGQIEAWFPASDVRRV